MVLPKLDISYDMEDVMCTTDKHKEPNYADFLTEVLLFHPNLELFISVNNLRHGDKTAFSRYARAEDTYKLGDNEGRFAPSFTDTEMQTFWTNRTLSATL